MRRMRAATIVAVSLSLAPALARADDTAGALFEQGLADMLAGKYDVACPTLAESFRLEPLAGALFTLAECESKWGKLASARAHYLDYLERVEKMTPDNRDAQGERPKVAREQIDALAVDVPELTIELAPGTPESAVITRDGARVPPSMIGVAIPVDPGRHELRIEADGRAARVEVVEIARGEKRRVTLALRAAQPVPKPDGEPDRVAGPPTGPLAIAAYISGGIGIAGAIAGTVAGAVALDAKSDVDAECIDHECTPAGLDAVDTAQTAGTVSTVTLVVGGVGIAAGITLWLLAGGEGDGEPPLALVPTADGFALRW